MTELRSIIKKLTDSPTGKVLGVKQSELDMAELKMGHSLPEVLKELYLLAGKNYMLMESFHRFALPSQLECIDNKIIFLEENQEVCYWRFAVGEENPSVYQLTENNDDYKEKLKLNDFIKLILYYQCAQKGYEFCGTAEITNEDLEIFIHTEWEEVIHYNGLQIYWKTDCLLWYFYEEEYVVSDYIYFSARTQEAYEQNSLKYNLEEI